MYFQDSKNVVEGSSGISEDLAAGLQGDIKRFLISPIRKLLPNHFRGEPRCKGEPLI
jgi:hypothetical protein